MIKAFLAPYLMPIKIFMLVSIILYVAYLYWKIENLQDDVKDLKSEKVLWLAENERLALAVVNQNKAVDGIAKISQAMQQIGQDLLKQAKQGNTIRQVKINAASARIILKNPSDCETAIDQAKKELAK